MGLDWTCPYCQRHATLTSENMDSGSATLTKSNVHGPCRVYISFYICPNANCKKLTLSSSLIAIKQEQNEWKTGKAIHSWNLLPMSKAQTFPNYVPDAIREDYNEACLIKDLSPKASATLSRRCLQGILRDYWKVKPGNLIDEIEAIKDKIDPLTWQASEAVRKVGNIGAHMQKDINLMIDVEPKEAELLIELIEVLVKDWYIATENRKAHLNTLIAVAEKKDQAKKHPATAATS